ncbi:hypothetical protein NC653_008098 [Populus alba x Populus x berolinensis]|uniref:Uncharacterized protein n=1 Tax=Populus alba x Populus x berolinensis TaxID=444605 RepID=A0AAD6W824_9ROSI|nr:hypothetical protein NC653_008098 [Populus alba x Populus x berolinensis]
MNDVVEVANKNVKKIIHKMVITYKDWYEMLPFALPHIKRNRSEKQRNNAEKTGGLEEKEEQTCVPLFSSQRNRGGHEQKRRKRTTSRGTNRNRKEEDEGTRKAETEEREQCWWNSPFTPPSSFAKQQIPITEEEGENRERPGERGLIDRREETSSGQS